jgi:hypothetical protein
MAVNKDYRFRATFASIYNQPQMGRHVKGVVAGNPFSIIQSPVNLRDKIDKELIEKLNELEGSISKTKGKVITLKKSTEHKLDLLGTEDFKLDDLNGNEEHDIEVLTKANDLLGIPNIFYSRKGAAQGKKKGYPVEDYDSIGVKPNDVFVRVGNKYIHMNDRTKYNAIKEALKENITRNRSETKADKLYIGRTKKRAEKTRSQLKSLR